MPDADFWVKSKGTDQTIGTPHKDFKSDDIGIKVTRTDILFPDYLFYVFMWLHSSGQIKQFATPGTVMTLSVGSLEKLILQPQ